MEMVRIDKWLWAARFFKTRSIAKDAITSGKVKKDGMNLKPSAMLKLDDKLTIRRGHDLYEIIVQGLSDKRGSATLAQQLYNETETSKIKREQIQSARQAEPKFDHRPDKKQRRQIRQFKTSSD